MKVTFQQDISQVGETIELIWTW